MRRGRGGGGGIREGGIGDEYFSSRNIGRFNSIQTTIGPVRKYEDSIEGRRSERRQFTSYGKCTINILPPDTINPQLISCTSTPTKPSSTSTIKPG